MNKATFAARREKLRVLMYKADLSAMLVTLDANRFYLSGFELHDPQINESAGCLIINRHGRSWLCTDPRYYDAARALWEEDRIFIYRGNGMVQVNGLLKERFSGPVGFEAAALSVAAFETVGAGLSMQGADGMIESLRLIKEDAEIERIERSCALNHKLMEWLPGVLAPGRAEAQVAWDIEQFFRNHGAEELAFSSIVAVGGNAALPHAEPGGTEIRDGCGVLVDVGCRLDRYCSDQTRCFWVGGKPDPVFAGDLALIQEGQRRAIDCIRPGVEASVVYGAARSFLDERGVGHLFTHGLGHGVGLQTHEAPSLGGAASGVLRPGMIVTVEPGLYRPGQCGVRWEHMALVTDDGARVL